MAQPAANNPPIVTTDLALRDVSSAIDFILRRRGLSKLNLMGWSWGAVSIAAYAADHPDKVEYCMRQAGCEPHQPRRPVAAVRTICSHTDVALTRTSAGGCARGQEE